MANRLAVVTLDSLVESWVLHLKASNKSPRTVQSYHESAGQLCRFLAERGMPTEPAHVHREHVEAYITDVLERHKPATAALRYRSLQQLFRWMLSEGEIASDPMARMKPPRVADQPVPIFSDSEVAALLAVCSGKDFESRRDTAIIRMLDGTGARLAEATGARMADLDLARGRVTVVGKGGSRRELVLHPAVVEAIDRYLRLRRRHPHSGLTYLWLGTKGRLTESGIAQMLKRRGRQAGVENCHAHRFRHGFAHTWQARGGSEAGLMSAAGWKSRSMLQRYAASTAAERAAEEAERLGMGQR